MTKNRKPAAADSGKPSVTILGMGYIGLPTAALIASRGMNVLGVDVNKAVVDTVNKGKIHIVEPDLEGLVHHAVSKGRLVASIKPQPSDVFIVTVPTPFKKSHQPDLSYVERAVVMAAPHLRAGNLFIIESTSPVGTTERMADVLFKQRPDLKGKLFIAYCPERVLPGSVIYELQQNDRVIGGIDDASTEAAVRFYSLFVRGTLHRTNSRTAEMTKLVENAYRDVNIAFANELSIISEKAGINVNELIHLASKHPRVKILTPGPGVGGHCIAVDPWFIASAFPKEAKLIRLAREVNTYKAEWVLDRIRTDARKLQKRLGRAPVIACMGLAYKPDIDDLRESPALEIYETLENEGYHVMAVEPNLRRHPRLPITDTLRAVRESDLLVFLVNHKEFQGLPVADKQVLDFCGVTRF
ncbi:MAG: UDP-N-acetyl-D-mannosamine dehydrogenase [Bacteroidota bacterium]